MSFFMILTKIRLSHEFGLNTNKPNQSEIAAVHKIPSPTREMELMKFKASMNTYCKFFPQFVCFYEIFLQFLYNNDKFHRNI